MWWVTKRERERKRERRKRLAAIWSTRKYLLECDLRIEEEAQEALLFMTQDNEWHTSPFDASHQKSLERAVVRLLEVLTLREVFVITLRFGLNVRTHHLHEIGEYLNLSQTTIGMIEGRALKKMKHHIGKSGKFLI